MIPEPNCDKRKCIHYLGVIQPDGTELTEKVACRAFPNGIPSEIAYGRNKHLTVHPDQDNDIVYEREEDTE
jgi:hypothetical protein